MSLEPDMLADRRGLRRRLSVWRALAFLCLALAVAALALFVAGPGPLQSHFDHIARIRISGFIGDQKDNLKLFDDVAASGAKAVLVVIDSPGGATTGGEALYLGLRKLSESKPTVAVIDGLGASAAYMASIATDHIVARQSALVGSIGVLIQFPNVSGLMNTLGVKLESVKSSPLKASPNGLEPSSPESLAALAAVVDDTYAWFKGLVKDRRHFDDAALAAVSDGRIFTGKQALDLKLIDALGHEKEALDWLESEKKIDRTLPIIDWEKPQPALNLPMARASLAFLADAAGFPDLARSLNNAAPIEAGALDGLVSVWHP